MFLSCFDVALAFSRTLCTVFKLVHQPSTVWMFAGMGREVKHLSNLFNFSLIRRTGRCECCDGITCAHGECESGYRYMRLLSFAFMHVCLSICYPLFVYVLCVSVWALFVCEWEQIMYKVLGTSSPPSFSHTLARCAISIMSASRPIYLLGTHDTNGVWLKCVSTCDTSNNNTKNAETLKNSRSHIQYSKCLYNRADSYASCLFCSDRIHGTK